METPLPKLEIVSWVRFCKPPV